MTLEQRKIEFLEEYKLLVAKHKVCIHSVDAIKDVVELDRRSEVEAELEFMNTLINDFKRTH